MLKAFSLSPDNFIENIGQNIIRKILPKRIISSDWDGTLSDFITNDRKYSSEENGKGVPNTVRVALIRNIRLLFAIPEILEANYFTINTSRNPETITDSLLKSLGQGFNLRNQALEALGYPDASLLRQGVEVQLPDGKYTRGLFSILEIGGRIGIFVEDPESEKGVKFKQIKSFPFRKEDLEEIGNIALEAGDDANLSMFIPGKGDTVIIWDSNKYELLKQKYLNDGIRIENILFVSPEELINFLSEQKDICLVNLNKADEKAKMSLENYSTLFSNRAYTYMEGSNQGKSNFQISPSRYDPKTENFVRVDKASSWDWVSKNVKFKGAKANKYGAPDIAAGDDVHLDGRGIDLSLLNIHGTTLAIGTNNGMNKEMIYFQDIFGPIFPLMFQGAQEYVFVPYPEDVGLKLLERLQIGRGLMKLIGDKIEKFKNTFEERINSNFSQAYTAYGFKKEYKKQI